MFANLWKRKAPHMVGIDIGSHQIKAILLKKISNGYKLVSHASIALKKGAVVDHDIKDKQAVIDALKRLSASLPKGHKFAAVAVSGSAVISKVIFMDASLNEDEMEAQIEIEADNLIPYPADEVSMDFEVLGPNALSPTKVDVLLSACRTENVDMRVDIIDAIGMEAKIVDVEGYALGRSIELVYRQLPSDAESKVIAIVDIGASVATLAILNQGDIRFVRDQAIGGEQLTQGLMINDQISYEQAEQCKRLGQFSADQLELVSRFQTQLVQYIKRALQIYSTAKDNVPVDFIVLTGGTAKLAGLANCFTQSIGVPTIVANPFAANLEAEDIDKQRLEQEISSYMLACGLALRSYGPWRT